MQMPGLQITVICPHGASPSSGHWTPALGILANWPVLLLRIPVCHLGFCSDTSSTWAALTHPPHIAHTEFMPHLLLLFDARLCGWVLFYAKAVGMNGQPVSQLIDVHAWASEKEAAQVCGGRKEHEGAVLYLGCLTESAACLSRCRRQAAAWAGKPLGREAMS